MPDGSDEYQQAITDLAETYRSGMKGFAKWCAENWKITERDDWAIKEPPEYIRGFNAGMDAVDAALDAFMEEFGP